MHAYFRFRNSCPSKKRDGKYGQCKNVIHTAKCMCFQLCSWVHSVVSKGFYRFGPCYGPVVENNKSFYTNVYAQAQQVNDTLLWYPEFNPQAVSYSNMKLSSIDVACGPTGDFTYACNINKLSCSADLHTIYEMCNSNIFHSCKNNSLSSIAKYQASNKNAILMFVCLLPRDIASNPMLV